MWLRSRRVQKFSGTFLETIGLRTWSRLQFSALHARKEPEIVKLIWQLHKDRRSLLTAFDAFLVYSVARTQAEKEGAFAEVGVYKGASAKLICEVKGDKPLHLFDTFEGLPRATEPDGHIHRLGQYKGSLESVQEYLKEYNNVHYHKGLFPDSTKSVEDTIYAFVHFDVDLYESTKACLEYFYPRMIAGSVMMSHDYDWGAGVRKAFDEFFADKPEGIIEQPTTQCVVMKL